MNDLRNIQQLKTNTLWILKPKWYKESYELTDNTFVYAKIYSKGWKQTTFFETEDKLLSICQSWKGSLSLKTQDGSVIGVTASKLFKRRITFILSNGRSVSYYNPSVWKDEYIWEDEFGNEIIRMKFGSLSGKTTITFDKRAAEIPDFYELVFIGLKLHLLQLAVLIA